MINMTIPSVVNSTGNSFLGNITTTVPPSSGNIFLGNITTTVPPSDDSILEIFSKLVCMLVIVLGLLGNSLVLIVFGSRYSKLKACELLMISLAVADLVGTIVLPTTQLHEMMGGNFQPIHDVGCKITHFLIITSVTVSSLTLVAITCDRFIIVKWPLRERASFEFIRFFVIFIWILGCGPGMIYLVGGNMRLYRLNNGREICRAFLSQRARVIHVLITFIVQVAMPVVVMVILYSLIIYELWKSTKMQLFCLGERQMVARYKRNKKAIQLLIVIVTVFFVCITPANLFYLVYLFQLHSLTNSQVIHIFAALQMLQMANSCVNPIIYSKLHASFRRTTFEIFCSCCLKKLREYNWEDFGESFKTAVTSSFHYASLKITRKSTEQQMLMRSSNESPSNCGQSPMNSFSHQVKDTKRMNQKVARINHEDSTSQSLVKSGTSSTVKYSKSGSHAGATVTFQLTPPSRDSGDDLNDPQVSSAKNPFPGNSFTIDDRRTANESVNCDEDDDVFANEPPPVSTRPEKEPLLAHEIIKETIAV